MLKHFFRATIDCVFIKTDSAFVYLSNTNSILRYLLLGGLPHLFFYKEMDDTMKSFSKF